MVPELTLEVIYLNQPTDFKMEFELCASINARFLSVAVKSRSEFLSALSKGVVRSRAIITVGSFNPLDSAYLPKIIAKATGYDLKPVDKQKFGISANGDIPLPETSLPLVDTVGNLAGCVLEKNDQSIIMLGADRELRHKMINDLVCPYLKIFANKKNSANIPEPTSIPSAEQKADPKEEAVSVNTEPENIVQEPSVEEKQEPVFVKTQVSEISGVADDSIAEAVESTLPDTKQAERVSLADTEEAEPPVKEPAVSVAVQTEEPKAEEPAYETGTESARKYTVLEQPKHLADPFDLKEFLIDEDEPDKKSKKHRRWLKVIISAVLVIAVLICTYFGYEWVFQPMHRENVYKSTREMYGQTWAGLPENMLYKFGKLYQTNSDIYGWLNIPNTSVNLPVVSTTNNSELYYQTHLFEGSVNRYGTPYTKAKLGEGDYTRNIVIYGKETKQGGAFSDLKKYLKIDHYREAPTFSFDTLYLENKWKIFSVFKIENAKANTYLQTSFFDDEEFLEYLNTLKKVSLISTEIDLSAGDQIVSLVCQSEGIATVVVARRVRDGESPLVDVTGTTVNEESLISSEIPANANPSGLTELTSEDMSVSSEDVNMADGASSRFEQQAPVSSTVIVKPTAPTISVPELSSSPSTSASSKQSSTSSTVSKAPQNSSAVTSSGTAVTTNKLPTLTVTNNFNGKKVSGPANEIVAQILEAEMGSGYHIEALKAQAVAAYSWLLCNGSAKDKYPSAPMKTAGARCIEAANAVAGQVAVYGGNVAQTYYYAISAGRTAYSKDIWSNQLPYLVSVDSSVDKSVSGYQTIRRYKASDVAKWANSLLNVDLTSISDKSKWFSCTYDANGIYCTKVKIGGVEKKGTYLRDTFFNSTRTGSNVLRSSAYTITYDKAQDEFVFTVRGYGHGVGMSQTGANAYAKSGWNYEKILKHYYTGISLGTYYVD